MNSLRKKVFRLSRNMQKLKWSVYFLADGRVILSNDRICLTFKTTRQFFRNVSRAVTSIASTQTLSPATWSAFCMSASYPDRRAREQVLFLCFSAVSSLLISSLHFFSDQLLEVHELRNIDVDQSIEKHIPRSQ